MITINVVNWEVLVMTAIDLENITSMIFLGTMLFQQGPDIILLCIFISHSTDVICSVFSFPITQALPLFFFIWTWNTRMNNDKFHWRIYVQRAKWLDIYDNIYIKVRTNNYFDQGRMASSHLNLHRDSIDFVELLIFQECHTLLWQWSRLIRYILCIGDRRIILNHSVYF